jgi:large subunit ribosomal protein L13
VSAGFFVTAGDPVKTFSPKPHDIERRWYVIDAEGAVLGRLASEVAKLLRGKHKPIFAPHADTGDHVIIVNAKGVRLTGGKEEKKIMYRHSGYPGGISGINYGRLMAERPKFAVERAIKGMLPSNRLGRQMAKKLSVYDGPSHPHEAQRPEPLPLGQIPKWEGLPVPKPQPERKATPTEPTKKRAGRRGTAKPVTAKSTAKRGGTGTSGRTTRPAARGTGAKAGAAKTSKGETTSSRKATGGRKRSAGTEKASTETAPKTRRSRKPSDTEES